MIYNNPPAFDSEMFMWFMPLILLAALWELFWRGVGLYRAARRKHVGWFVLMLLVNSLGIIEIIYLFVVLKIKPKDIFKR